MRVFLYYSDRALRRKIDNDRFGHLRFTKSLFPISHGLYSVFKRGVCIVVVNYFIVDFDHKGKRIIPLHTVATDCQSAAVERALYKKRICARVRCHWFPDSFATCPDMGFTMTTLRLLRELVK